MDFEDTLLANQGVEPEKIEKTPAAEDTPQETVETPTDNSSLNTEPQEKPTEDKPPVETKETTQQSSEPADDVFEVETDEDLAKFVSDHFGKDITPDRLKSILEDPKEPQSSYANDTIKELNDYVAQGGDIKDFMEFKMTNFSEMSDLDIVTKKMQRDYPSLSKADIQRRLDRQFKLSEDRYDDEEVADGKLDLKIAAEEARNQFTKLQEQYSSPLQTKVEQKQPEPEYTPEELKAFQDNMQNSINNLKSIEIGGVTYEVNDGLRDKVAKAPADIGDLFVEGDNFNFDKYNQFKAIALDPEAFVKTIKAQAESDALKALKEKRNNSQLEPEAHNPTNVNDHKKASEKVAMEVFGGGRKYTI